MDNTPEQVKHLEQQFKKIDKDNDGLINEAELKAYNLSKGIVLQPLDYKDIFIPLGLTMNMSNFVTWQLGYKANLHFLSLIKFNLLKHINKFSDANPPQISDKIKKSFLRFKVNEGKQSSNKQQFIKLLLGVNKIYQQQQRQILNKLFERQVSSVMVLLKFKVKKEAETIRGYLQNTLNQLKQVAISLDPQIGQILNYISIQCRVKDNTIYTLIESNSIFIQDVTNVINQFIMMISPMCEFQFHFHLISSMWKTILTKGLNSSVVQMETQIGLDIDEMTLNKIRKIMNEIFQKNSHNNYPQNSQKLTMFLISLLEQVQFETTFHNVSQFLQATGTTEKSVNLKDNLQFLKQMQIGQIIGSVSENGLTLLKLLKQDCYPDVELSINVKNAFVKLDLGINIEGIFDLIL